jgi:hypothetical protein
MCNSRKAVIYYLFLASPKAEAEKIIIDILTSTGSDESHRCGVLKIKPIYTGIIVWVSCASLSQRVAVALKHSASNPSRWIVLLTRYGSIPKLSSGSGASVSDRWN